MNSEMRHAELDQVFSPYRKSMQSFAEARGWTFEAYYHDAALLSIYKMEKDIGRKIDLRYDHQERRFLVDIHAWQDDET